MKLRLQVDGTVFEYELKPRLACTWIVGNVFLKALRIAGIAALFAAGIMLFLYGAYLLIERI